MTGFKSKKKAAIDKLSSGEWPKVNKGSHLTVTTYEDGSTELVWDDEALMRDVREAIDAYELGQMKPAVRAKTTRKKKET